MRWNDGASFSFETSRTMKDRKTLLISLLMFFVGVLSSTAQSLESVQLLDFPGAVFTMPLDINDSGVVTGYFVDDSSAAHGFVWANGRVIAVFDFPDAVLTVPYGINNAGQVVGGYLAPRPDDPGINRVGAFLWSQGAFTDITVPGSYSSAYDIDGAGNVVGWVSFFEQEYPVEYTWRPGAPGSRLPSGVHRLSEAGDVVGTTHDGRSHYRYTPDGGVQPFHLEDPECPSCAVYIAGVSTGGALVGATADTYAFVASAGQFHRVHVDGSVSTQLFG